MLKDLAAYRTFVAIVEQSSLTAAAEALGRSVQAVSRDLMRLESDLGSPLVLRTTRRRQLTTAGKEFYRRIAATLAELDRAEEDFRARTLRVAGPIKITGPTLFGPRVVTPIITDFLARYTEVSIALDLTDSFVDPAASGADFTIRIGDTPASSLIARRLGEVRRVAVASPAFLEARGRPQRPSELSTHDCVVRRGTRRPRDGLSSATKGRLLSKSKAGSRPTAFRRRLRRSCATGDRCRGLLAGARHPGSRKPRNRFA